MPDKATYKQILAIETATPVCSVALRKADGRMIEKRVEGSGVHSEKTFLFIRELLDSAGLEMTDLDAVLFSNGPGSYTGLRIGAAAIKGLLFGRDIPLFLFPTLLSYAIGAKKEKLNTSQSIHAVIDARRNHLYHQPVSADLEKIGEPIVSEIEKIRDRIEANDTVIGTGWERLDLDPDKNIRTIGTEGISAVSLLEAFGNELTQEYFKKADPELFEPDYITLSQVNNSEIDG
ncbi:MAG: tRNA (adenosine(37)-N6)-threonylcarbamoyltransferase complex dimerization subunit type 1 TsaB [Balneolaceae bacterium]|nr:tRNA (adenosine(37)-N6)-threonylcarbamoyltransferase complex dimerization subunit type 1 TsaB [Balneolaceae bacterium]